jgi:uncharacterized repeat protein (TIGR03803 family)
MASRAKIPASISNINLRARTATFVPLAILATILTIASPAHAQTFTVLHTFTASGDGQSPTASPILAGSGNLYGVATYELDGDGGGAFRLSEHGSGWVLNPLFTNAGAGNSKLVIGPDGNLYGATAEGGIDNCGEGGGCGTVFMLQPPPAVCASVSCPWRETVLYQFTNGSDGATPASAVVFDTAGNLYGVTSYGGDFSCNEYYGCGVVYKLTRSGSGWTESVVHTFVGGSDGYWPDGGLVFDPAENLYGVTNFGGSGTNGVLYELSPSNGGWTETILHDFPVDAGSYGTLAMDAAGDLYGVTLGSAASTVFELSQPGNWSYAVLHSFTDNDYPIGGLTFDRAGNLYGVTIQAGEYGHGYAYKLAPSDGSWTLNHLHDFSQSDGTYANGLLTLDANGDVYGTSGEGGYFNNGSCYLGCGTVWEITPSVHW